jgi:hypothetical protein
MMLYIMYDRFMIYHSNNKVIAYKIFIFYINIIIDYVIHSITMYHHTKYDVYVFSGDIEQESALRTQTKRYCLRSF